MFLLGKLASEFFLMRFSFVILVAGVVWTFWGLPRLRTLAFPFLLLATMVPLPVTVYNSLAAPLQLLASDLATRIAQSFGISVFRDGNVIQLAGTSLGVAEACSGLNSLSALIVGSLLLGYLLCSRTASRVLLFAAAIPSGHRRQYSARGRHRVAGRLQPGICPGLLSFLFRLAGFCGGLWTALSCARACCMLLLERKQTV